MKMRYQFLIAVLLIFIALLSGCSSDAIYIFTGASNISGTNTYILNVSNNPYSDWWIAFPNFNVKVNATRADGLYINWSYILNPPSIPSLSGYNTTIQLESYFNTLYYSIFNPRIFINETYANTKFNDTAYCSALVSSVGNWSNDKSDYNTTAQLNTLYLGINDQRYNDTTNINNLNTSLTSFLTTNYFNSTQDYTNDSVSWVSYNSSLIKCPDEQFLTTDPTTGQLRCNDLELYHYPRYYKMTDFESTTAVYNNPWVLGALASGTAPLLPSEENHPGIVQFNSSTSASSGYTYNIANAFVYSLTGNMTTELVFRPYTKYGRNATTNGNITNIKFGFQDVFTGADSVDGVYFNITQDTTTTFNFTLVGSSNSVRTYNQSRDTLTQLSNNTWYTATIFINSTSLATGTIKDASGTILWTGIVTTVPNGAGRQTSQQVLCWVTTGGVPVATKLCDVDFTSVGYASKVLR